MAPQSDAPLSEIPLSEAPLSDAQKLELIREILAEPLPRWFQNATGGPTATPSSCSGSRPCSTTPAGSTRISGPLLACAGRWHDHGMSTPAGGWIRFGPPRTPQQSAQRRPAAAAAAAADHARRARARTAAYGASTDHTTTTRTMPLSGVRFTWRADGYFHVTLPGAPDPADPDWLPWSGDPDITGHSQRSPGDSADPTWWLWWGQARETDTVTAWLADGADAPVTRLGGLWICEYTAVAQPLYLARNGDVDCLPARRAAYLPPAQHLWQQDAPDPRA